MEPIIEEGHEWLVHHIVLYSCNTALASGTADSAHGFTGHCYMFEGDERPHPMDQCRTVYAVWAVGGEVSGVSGEVSGVSGEVSGVGGVVSGVGEVVCGVSREVSGVSREVSGVGREVSGVGEVVSKMGRGGVGLRVSGEE